MSRNNDIEFSNLKVGEYFVLARPKIKFESFYKDSEGELYIVTGGLDGVKLKTMVKSYADARAHLLAVANRIRNYVAFSFQNAIPLDVSMIGKRENTGQWFPVHATFEGSTLMPFTDGGIGDHSFFRTMFGSSEGSPPPSSALESEDSFKKWGEWVTERLNNSQTMLNNVSLNSPLDIALNSLGESIWAKPYKEKLMYSWRAIEAICKLDNPKKKIYSRMLLSTIRTHSDSNLSDLEFEKIRLDRNKSVHWVPSYEESTSIVESADSLFKISVEVTKSTLKEKGIQ